MILCPSCGTGPEDVDVGLPWVRLGVPHPPEEVQYATCRCMRTAWGFASGPGRSPSWVLRMVGFTPVSYRFALAQQHVEVDPDAFRRLRVDLSEDGAAAASAVTGRLGFSSYLVEPLSPGRDEEELVAPMAGASVDAVMRS